MSEKRFLTFLLSFLITLPFLQELHLLSYKEKKETRLTVVKNPKKSHTLVGLFSRDGGESDCSEWECRKNL